MSSRQVLWTVPRVEEFKSLAILSPLEAKVFDLHVGIDGKGRRADYEIVQELQDTEFSTSLSAVQDAIRYLKDSYDAVQPYSQTLDPRKLHANELKRSRKRTVK